MGKKSLKIKIDDLSEENYIDVANEAAKAIKNAAPNCKVSILGADPDIFEGKDHKQIKGK